MSDAYVSSVPAESDEDIESTTLNQGHQVWYKGWKLSGFIDVIDNM